MACQRVDIGGVEMDAVRREKASPQRQPRQSRYRPFAGLRRRPLTSAAVSCRWV